MPPHPEPDGERDRGPPSDGDGEELENIPTPQFVIDNANSESDSEEEDGAGYYGYQMLPQDPQDVNSEIIDTSLGPTDDQSESCDVDTNVDDSCPGSSDLADSCCADVTSSCSGDIADDRGACVADCDKPEQLSNMDHSVLHSPATGYMTVPDLSKPESKELLWNKQRSSHTPMDQRHAEKVKMAMSGILLPTTNIPDWATNITEEDWRNKLASLQTDDTS